MKDKPLRYLILSDLHIPDEDKQSLAAVEKLLAAHQFDGLVYIGDVLNLDCISSHNKRNLRAVESKRILDEYKIADEILSRHLTILRKRNPDAKVYWLEGNHEDRLTRYIDLLPQLEGLIELENVLKLKERGITYIKSWSENKTLKLGKMRFHHGIYTSDHCCKQMVQRFGCNITFGHSHTVQEYTWHNLAYNEPKVGISIGCLCNRPAYLKGPSRWQQAIMLIDIDKRSGNFYHNIIRICNHQFYFNGVLYGPNTRIS
jgi:predicted phosphodiesterase